MRRIGFLVFAAAVLAAPAAFGEDTDAPARPWLPPEGSLVVNLPSDATIAAGLLQFLVTHRFRDPVHGSDAHTLYSLDSGADFGLGFSYSPVRNFELALYRSGIQDDYQISAKYALRPGGAGSIFGAAIIAGGSARREPFVVDENGNLSPDSKARSAFFAQAVLAVHFWNDRVSIAAVPSYASRTSSEERVFNVPVHAAVAVSKSWNIQGEYIPPRKALNGSIAQWSFGIEKVLYRHRFTFFLGNSNASAVDQYLSGDYALAQKRQLQAFDNGFRNNDWHIGFNITRQFKIGGL
jgi:hypothetical protein